MDRYVLLTYTPDELDGFEDGICAHQDILYLTHQSFDTFDEAYESMRSALDQQMSAHPSCHVNLKKEYASIQFRTEDDSIYNVLWRIINV